MQSNSRHSKKISIASCLMSWKNFLFTASFLFCPYWGHFQMMICIMTWFLPVFFLEAHVPLLSIIRLCMPSSRNKIVTVTRLWLKVLQYLAFEGMRELRHLPFGFNLLETEDCALFQRLRIASNGLCCAADLHRRLGSSSVVVSVLETLWFHYALFFMLPCHIWQFKYGGDQTNWFNFTTRQSRSTDRWTFLSESARCEYLHWTENLSFTLLSSCSWHCI